MSLALHLLNPCRCGWIVFWLGELGKEYDARARRVCPLAESGTKKEVTINCGWTSVARAGRILNFAIQNHDHPVFINLLVVTVRAAWFNFRGWKKRR